ncbi:MAG TPA: DUF1552 domain-containing protein [Polyangiaceae bacterium]|nr:DUF1552 domain-containing protein [Polyangiaceae bacterium]
MKRFILPRRTLLRGLGSVAVGLPVLECMLNGNGEAFAQSAALPKRYAIVFAGQTIGGDGWEEDKSQVAGVRKTERGHFIADTTPGAGYAPTTPLKPLEKLGLMGDFSLVSNLKIPWNPNSVEGADVPAAGAFRDFHGGGASPLLCGTRSQTSSFKAASITSDQIVAGLNKTAQGSLVLRAQPSWYLSGSEFAGRQYISYGAGGKAIEAQINPSIVYNSLFDNFVPKDGGEQAAHDFELRARQSVLSLITDKRQRILSKVGAADKARLQAHFDEIRELELRIAAAPPTLGDQCQKPPAPTADLPLGGDNAGSDSSTIGTNTGYSNEDTRARLLADLIHMAFVCDITRVATLQITVFQSHMNVFPISTDFGMPIRADLHECGHNGDETTRGQEPVSMCLGWHIGHYAYLMDKLKRTPEGAGNVLDNTVMIFMPEAGHGIQLNDGTSNFQTHSVDRMVLLVGGRAGGLTPGRHIVAPQDTHPGQVLISAMQAAGYTDDKLGEVTGKFGDVFG